jgi:hypothetical protein
MNRRNFIRNSSAAAAASLLGMHNMPAGCAQQTTGAFSGSAARIIHLDLITVTPLTELKTFYAALLQLPLVSEKGDRFTIRTGETTISFIQAKEKGTAPFYHFAFNIPENKILKARKWQLKRTALSATPPQLIDSDYPDDVRHFRNWNAHSVFFWDPAGNLVEYIARHDLKNSSDGEFSSKDLLCASEIAFIVQDTETVADEIKSSFKLNQYRGGDENFRAIGDENGLLLVIKKGRVWESHTSISKTPGTFETAITIKADKGKKWEPLNYPFAITASS